MHLKRFLAATTVAITLSAGSIALFAQGIITGSITGTVQDSTGAIVSGATVVATNPTTGLKFTETAKQSGEFSFNSIPVGVYTLTISASGFGDLKLERVGVETGKATGLGAEKLSPGQAVETVEVSVAQNILETVQSQVTTTFDSSMIANLPTGGGFDELALLIPGVVSTHSDNFANTNGAGISSNGQRGRSNNFEIDGQSNNDNSVTGPQVFFSNEDALAEIQVITDNFGAQYGRDAGSVINYVTKSGTNQIHGSAFEFYEGSWLSSLTQGQKGPQFGFCTPAQVAAGSNTTGACTLPHKPRFDDNTFGGTLGGPILKDKLFGFGSALFGRDFSGQTILTSGTVGGATGYTPTQAGLTALAAAFPNNAGVQSLVAYGPYSVTTLDGKSIPVSPIPNSTKLTNFSDGVTTASIPVSQYTRTVSPMSTDEEVLGRLDYQATNKDRFFLRYFYQTNPTSPYNATVTGGIVDVTDKVHSVGSDWTHTFGPRVLNQLRYSFQQSTLLFQGGAFANCTGSNFASCPSSFTINASTQAATDAATGAAINITPVSSFGLSSSYPQGRVVKDTQIQDNLSLSFGKHSITTGGSFEYQNSPNVFLPSLSGAFTFTGQSGLLTQTGPATAVNQVSLAIGNPGIHFTEPDYAAYFQDDWKVSSSLTLNLGARYEFFSQSINLLNNISTANQTGASPLWSTALPLSVTTFPRTPSDYKHIEPRLGFAYNPAGLKSMVIRGGYAINIAPAFYNIFLNSYGSAPVVLSNAVACNGNCIPGGGANFTSVHAKDNGLLLTVPAGQNGLNPGSFQQTFVDPKFRQPTTQTYSLGVQQEVGRIAVVELRYVGAHTFADFQSINANPRIGAYTSGTTVVPGAQTLFPNYAGFAGITPCAATQLPAFPVFSGSTAANTDVGRIHCGQSLVRSRTNTSFEIYNSLQATVKTRNYHGLTADLAYTFSRTIDNASEIFSTDTAATTSAFAQNPLDNNIGERGVSGNSYPNVTSLGLTYVDPHFSHSHSLVGRVLGGFQLNTIYLFNSGQPYTDFQLTTEGSLCDNGFNSSSFNGSVDSCRLVLSNKNAPLTSVAKLGGSGVYRDLNNNVVNPNNEHWIINNAAEAITLGNPYPGVGRNTLRGTTYNNVQASIYKNNKINERFNLQLRVEAFNALNRAYYGAPNPEAENAAGTLPTFNTVIGNAGSNRNVEVGAKVLF